MSEDSSPPVTQLLHAWCAGDEGALAQLMRVVYDESVIEEDDGVLGLACEKMGPRAPKWISVRNVSLPHLSGDSASEDRQKAAVRLYARYGFWTTVQSAIATWAIISGAP